METPEKLRRCCATGRAARVGVENLVQIVAMLLCDWANAFFGGTVAVGPRGQLQG